MADTEDTVAAQYGGVVAEGAAADAQPAADTAAPAAPADDPVAAQFGGVAVPDSAPPKPTVEQPEKPSDLAGSAMTGLKQTLAPFLLSKEELSGPKSKADTAVEIGVNLGSDVALGAAVGSLVGPEGTLMGAGAGAVVHAVMAAYRGFGYEYAQAKAGGRAFDPLKGTVNSLAQLNPLVGKGGRLVKAGTQALLEAASQYQYSGDEQGAKFAGAVGGLVGALTHQQTGTWLAMLGQAGWRPNSNTLSSIPTPGEFDGLVQVFADGSTYRLGDRIEKAVANVRAEEPGFFDLGNKLDEFKTLTAKRAQLADLRKAIDPAGSKVAGLGAVEKDVLSDIGGFQKWFLDRPGARVFDDDIQGSFDHYAKTLGKDRMDKAYGMYKEQQLAVQEVQGFNNELAADLLWRNKATGDVEHRLRVNHVHDSEGNMKMPDTHERLQAMQDPLQNGWVDKLTDIKFVMRKVDAELGTNLEGVIDNFNSAKNQQSVVMATYLQQANQLIKQGRKAGVSNDDIGQWLANKSSNMLSGDQLKVAEGWRELFEGARKRLNNEGLDVQFLGGNDFASGGRYLPMRGKSGAEAATAIRREAERLESKYGHDFLDHADAFDLRRAVGRLTDTEPELVRYTHIDQAQHDALNPANSKKLQGYEAGATFQRQTGPGAPDFIRDYDVGKLFTNYLNNNFKAAYYHDPFMQASTQLDLLREMGARGSADYLEKYIKTISGQQSNFLAGVQYLTNKHKAMWQKIADNAPDTVAGSVKGKAAEAMAALPDFASFAISSIYPNYLGMNLRASLRNFAQPMLMTSPELGWEYGSKLVAKATAQTAWDKVKRGLNLEEELRNRSMAPGQHFGVAGDLADTGLRSVGVVGPVVEGLDKYNDLAMKLYSQTDNVNRYVTLKVAENLVKDMKSGNQRALDYARRVMSEGNKAAVRDLGITTMDDLAKADSGKLSDLLARQLISKTQFNYGKESLSEYGRDMGRLFSMFTKWPAMMYSDSAELLRNHGGVFGGGGVKVAQRYLAPMAALMMMGEYLTDTEHNPYQRYLIGSNLSDWAPAQSWKVGTPPVLQSAMDFSKTFLDMWAADKDKTQKLGEVRKFVKRQAMSYLPGTSLFNEYARYQKAFHPEEQQ